MVEHAHKGEGRRIQPAIMKHDPDEMTMSDIEPSVTTQKSVSAFRLSLIGCRYARLFQPGHLEILE
jgi:hypothetical protein